MKIFSSPQRGAFSLENRTALITGASSGIGRELAILFAEDGCNLVLVARNRSRLESLAADLRARHHIAVQTIACDLSKPAAPRAIEEALTRQCIEVDILVNNAGTQVYGKFAEQDLDRQLAMIMVNADALVHLTHLLLPGMIRRGSGRILNLGSTGAFAPGPLNAVYCATKAFVVSFSQAIAAELAGTGVTVTALCPGATDTAFITRHGMQDVRIFRYPMPPTRVAQIGFHALQKGCPLIVAGFQNQLQVLGFKLSAPFYSLTPPAILMAIGRLFMGRIGSETAQMKSLP